MYGENSVGVPLTALSIGKQAKDFKVGDIETYVVHPSGSLQVYHEDMILQPSARVITVEVKSVSKAKRQELEAA